MKNKIIITLIIVLQIFIASCNKTKQYNPADLLFNLYVDINLRPEAKYILILENPESKPQKITLSGSFYQEILRGEDIISGAVNLHFILINETKDGELSMNSFYDVPFGKTIRISENNLKSQEATQSSVNLSFTNIPDYDIVSRTAKTQDQGFTLNTFETPITTAAMGGETFESIQQFYACFQNGADASYKIERLPNQENYTIDFTDLNTNMVKYTFPKNINDATIKQANVQAWDNAILFGSPVEIYNLTDFSIFPTTSFAIFTPTFERYFSYYIQELKYEKNNQTFSNWSYSSTLQDEINLLDAGLSINPQPGQIPSIESISTEYSIAELTFETDNFSWTIHSPKTDNIYIPEIPLDVFDDLSNANNFLEMFLKIDEGKIKLIDYYPYTEYAEALGVYFGSDSNKLQAGTSYRTQEQTFSVK